MSKLNVTFKGHDLTEYMIITDIQRNIGTTRTNNLVKVGLSNGKKNLSKTLEEKYIRMSFILRYDLSAKRRELAKLLNGEGTLIIGDEKTIGYKATPEGDVDVAEKSFLGYGEIIWVVPDGLGHEIDHEEFTDLNGVLNVDNKGNYEAYPVLEATMTGENGLVAFITESGKVLQFGDPNAIDGYDYQQSDKVIHEMMRNSGGWSVNDPAAKIMYPNYMSDPTRPNVIDGSFKWAVEKEDAEPIYPEAVGEVWTGPLMYQEIPANSNNSRTGNFEFRTRFKFSSDTLKTGRVQFALQNGSRIEFGAIVRDSSMTSNQFIIEIWQDNKKQFEQALSRNDFNGGFFEVVLKRYGFEFTTELHQVGKLVGESVTASKSYVKTLSLETVKDVPITALNQWIAIFGNQQRSDMRFTDTKFTWVNVEKWQNLPNLFNPDDVFWVETSSGKMFLNGIEVQLETLGNQWDGFKLEPGESKIYCICSDWASKPNYKAYIKGAWL